MIHPDTEVRYISPEKGYGLVATKLIPKGTITWVLDKLDRIFTPEEVAKLTPPYTNIIDTYTFRDNKGNFILCWDNARFVNHSFKSNCLTTAYDYELAVRDIEPGEEITDDYGYLNISESFRAAPEKGSKRRLVNPDDLLRYHDKWDKHLLQAFKEFEKVNQPLTHLLDHKVLQKSVEIARGEREMDSIVNCYFDPSRNNN